MYRGEGSCILGFAGHRLGSSLREDATISRIGGLPIWHRYSMEDPFKTAVPKCATCGGASTLIVQLYAPVETDRSLYIFACENGCASRSSGGWTVIRNQSLAHAHTAADNHSAVTNTSAKPLPTAVSSTASFQSVFAYNPTEASFGLGGDDDDDLADLERMLQARDVILLGAGATETSSSSLDSTAAKSSTKEKSSATFAINQSMTASGGTSCADLVGVIAHPLSELVVEQSEEPVLSGRAARGGGVTDDYIKGLVLKYVASEREALAQDASGVEATCDARTLEMIEYNIGRNDSGRGGIDRNDDSSSSGSDDDEEDEENDGEGSGMDEDGYDDSSGRRRGAEGREGKPKAVSRHAGGSSGERKGKTGGRGASGVYESGERRLKGRLSRAERVFKRRIAAAPKQILRYAYEGLPLWCSDRLQLPTEASFAPLPGARKGSDTKPSHGVSGREIKVPVCESCGSERKFEMQLMPAIAEFLSFAQEGPPAVITSAAVGSPPPLSLGEDVVSALRLGMGVLAVWTCSAACAGGYREFCVFQPAE